MALSFAMALGFLLGYGVRELISRHRRAVARRRRDANTHEDDAFPRSFGSSRGPKAGPYK
jgi:hypothetical protein